MTLASTDASPVSVRLYLLRYYGKTPAEVDAAMAAGFETLQHGIAIRSYAGYVGDQLAAAEGWTEIEGVAEQDDDEEDDDDA